MKKFSIFQITLSLGALLGSPIALAAIAISDTPLYLTVTAPPAVLFNLSVEGPMGGPAYSGTYSATSEYLGIFDPQTCYTYASGMNGRFEPQSSGVANHVCSGQWSGNFLNWATMRAIDMFIWNLTGGNRVVDTKTETVLRAARYNSNWFKTRSNVTVPAGAAPASGSQTITYPGDYTFGFNETTYNIQVLVCKKTSPPGPESNCTAYTDNASTPNTYYKPEGLIQRNAERMRFALTSYVKEDAEDRDGGVLRSNLKYIGPRKWDDTNRVWVDNDAKEWWGTAPVTSTVSTACNSPTTTTPGLLVTNPEQCNKDTSLRVSTTSGLNSGIIAYINQFSDYGYKSHDPAGELFYESLNYFRNRGPTPEYSKTDTANGRTLSAITRKSTDGRAGGFWFYNGNDEWKDPITYSCQRNFIIGINDANPWLDKRLPGTNFTADKTVDSKGTTWRGTAACQEDTNQDTGCPVRGHDYGEPSVADTTFNVTDLTNKVGEFESLNNSWNNSGVYSGIIYNGSLVTSPITVPYRAILWQRDLVGGSVASSDNGTDNGTFVGNNTLCDSTTRTVDVSKGLGTVMGTCRAPYKQNSYYIAGLAYWANTQDIRSDLPKKQTVNTFMIDTQEPSEGKNILDGPRNMLWLAGKYGGFIEKNEKKSDNGWPKPDLPEEWDKDSDGIPDNYVFASDPKKLKDGLTNAFDNIFDLSASSSASSSSAVAANSTRLDTGSVVYQMRFSPLNWTGQAIAEKLNMDGTINSVLWNTDTTIGRLTSSSAASRQIFSWNPTTNTGSQFKCSGSWMAPTKTDAPDNSNCWLTPTQRVALREASLTAPLPSGIYWDDLLNYLRGDPTNETDTAGGRFRYRSVTLGDIINSDPLFVGDENLGYDVLPDTEGGGSSYAAYRYGTEARQKMLYVGANDGMLHAFDATTGTEVFTYVPNEVIQDSTGTPRMKLLAALNYSHKYFVDGSPNFSDVYTNSGWKTYLVASQGAGGRAIFALDISAATDGTIIMSPSKVLWEFGPNSDTNPDTKSSEIGYVLSQPAIARLPNQRWAAFFGNGPGGSSGKAKLFAIYLDANMTDKWKLGEDYLVFDTDDTTSNASITGNGLSGVSVIGDSYQTAQTVYAGDLLGRMWKFDVSATDISCNSGCGSGTLVFTTKSNQPITTAPAIGTHSKCGVMLYFGTGKYYETGDQTNADLQTLYGIWDQPGGAAISGTTNLYEYQIDKQGTAASGTEWRVIADNNTPKITDLYAPSGGANKDVCKNNPDEPRKRGWFVDLKVKGTTLNTGERVVTPALLRHGRAIFTTLDPSKTFCAGGGKSWIMEMMAESGATLTSGVFDINKDNKISSSVGSVDSNGICGDCVTNSAGVSSLASGISTGTMGIIKTPTVLTAGGVEYKLASGSTSGELVVIKEKGTGAPRASWRQLQ